ncbi:MAG: hypothetical protein MUE85_14115 [Microscillaceae bacterium]|jgi:hypothetical protein|nr:hypothetical protein [Microscillaceae bacterium]
MNNSFTTWETIETEPYQNLPLANKNSEISYLMDNQGNTFTFHQKDFIHNGQGIGIISMRVIQENESWLLEEIEDLFFNQFQVVFLHFVPWEKNRKLADYLHFQDDRTLQFKNPHKNEKFWQKIANYLKKNGLRVVPSV